MPALCISVPLCVAFLDAESSEDSIAFLTPSIDNLSLFRYHNNRTLPRNVLATIANLNQNQRIAH